MGVELPAECGVHSVLFRRAVAEGGEGFLVCVFMGQWYIETAA